MKEHDFKVYRWGHHLRPFGDDQKEITKRLFRKNKVRIYREYWGHAIGLKEGDIALQLDRDGRIIKYKIRNLEYEQDPHDMFYFRAYYDEIEIDDN